MQCIMYVYPQTSLPTSPWLFQQCPSYLHGLLNICMCISVSPVRAACTGMSNLLEATSPSTGYHQLLVRDGIDKPSSIHTEIITG